MKSSVCQKDFCGKTCLIEVDPLRGLPIYNPAQGKNRLQYYLGEIIINKRDRLSSLKGYYLNFVGNMIGIFFNETFMHTVTEKCYFDVICEEIGEKWMREDEYTAIKAKLFSEYRGQIYCGVSGYAKEALRSIFHARGKYVEIIMRDFQVGIPCDLLIHNDAVNRIIILPE